MRTCRVFIHLHAMKQQRGPAKTSQYESGRPTLDALPDGRSGNPRVGKGLLQLKGSGVELVVVTALGDKLLMVAALDDTTVL